MIYIERDLIASTIEKECFLILIDILSPGLLREKQCEVSMTHYLRLTIASINRFNGRLDNSCGIDLRRSSDFKSKSVEGVPVSGDVEVGSTLYCSDDTLLINSKDPHKHSGVCNVFGKESGSINVEIDTLAL